MIRLPGLIDPHVHIREPGAIHKEDWDSGTAAALAGGFTLVLAMPNTQPSVTDGRTLDTVLAIAACKARCDFAQYVGASLENVSTVTTLADRTAGLKMYLDQTFGTLRLDDMTVWMEHFTRWPHSSPLAIHAEGRSLAAAILMSALFQRPIHLCHVSTREEILLIRKTKEKGIPVTCEVTPHHLFLSSEDAPRLGPGRCEVRPSLASPADRQALWDNLDVIDCFASDHAPHTLAEKDDIDPPPGFPGLETSLPLLLTAISDGRLSLDDLVLRSYTNPRRIFHLPEQPETWVEIDPYARWEIHANQFQTRCGWTPFEGLQVQGCIRKVVLRGREAFKDGILLAQPGNGQNIRCCFKSKKRDVL
jgi:carbamoyl-phosphate synthase/aspartate carbamoyltransferase/dihydroorotase